MALASGDAPLALGSAKCLALLVYLALEPGPHTRDELAALLWGDYPDAAAHASLRQALKRVRAALGGAVAATRSAVELVAPLECDLLALRDAARRDPAALAG